MVDYLGVLAGFSHQTFPEQVFPFDISNDRVNKAWAKPKSDRSAAEQKLVETKDYYIGQVPANANRSSSLKTMQWRIASVIWVKA